MFVFPHPESTESQSDPESHVVVERHAARSDLRERDEIVEQLAVRLGIQELDGQLAEEERAHLESRLHADERLQEGVRITYLQDNSLNTLSATATLGDGTTIAEAKWNRREVTEDRKLVHVVQVTHFDVDEPSDVTYRGDVFFDGA